MRYLLPLVCLVPMVLDLILCCEWKKYSPKGMNLFFPPSFLTHCRTLWRCAPAIVIRFIQICDFIFFFHQFDCHLFILVAMAQMKL